MLKARALRMSTSSARSKRCMDCPNQVPNNPMLRAPGSEMTQSSLISSSLSSRATGPYYNARQGPKRVSLPTTPGSARPTVRASSSMDRASITAGLGESVWRTDRFRVGGYLSRASGYQCVLTNRLASSAVKRPVLVAPISLWKRRIAARVNGPKIPSACP